MESAGESLVDVAGILWGVVISLGLLFLGNVVLGVITTFVPLSTVVPTNLLFILNYVALFIGGIVTAYRVGSNGWLNGGLVGLVYMGLILMLGGFWHSFSFSPGLGLRLLLAFLVAGLGGIIGVNVV